MQDKKINEKELREKIRKELEEKHRRNQKSSGGRTAEKAPDDSSAEPSGAQMVSEAQIRAEVADEVYGKYPEFIRCSNHLDEVRWLTPLELDEEFEFYPVEESWLSRQWKKLFPFRPKISHKSDEAKQIRETAKSEMETDARTRIARLREHQSEMRRHLHSELEAKIYEEELDRFYRSKKGYKKYRNHAGETRWMTQEEYENQDDYVEEVIPTGRLWLQRALMVLLTMIIIAAGWFFLFRFQTGKEVKSYLMVDLNDEHVHLYIDKNLAVGFEPSQPYALEPGIHEISVMRSGFISEPRVIEKDFKENDTVQVTFNLLPQVPGESGTVFIDVPHPDAEIFVDGEFHGTIAGNQNHVSIPAGEHSVTLEKSGYVAIPPQHAFRLTPGDTVSLNFRLRPGKSKLSSRNRPAGSQLGLIEVRSNVKNADILLDGQPTGFKTDYVLQKIPFGKHIIRIAKDGYKVYPEERIVRLNENQRRVQAGFTLTSTIRQVEIITEPVDGAIFVNDKRLGSGRVMAALPFGKHEFTFGEVDYYQKPEAQSITISEDTPEQFRFSYVRDFYVAFSPEGVKPSYNLGSISPGIILSDDKFRQNKEAGPEVRTNEQIDEQVWWLGYAYQYRNPPGSDGLVFNFNLPRSVNLGETLHLKIWAYKTSDNFPLVIGQGNSYYRIIINNVNYRNQVLPSYDQSKINEKLYDAFTVNEHLRYGQNKILISTTDNTTAHLLLWKIVIE